MIAKSIGRHCIMPLMALIVLIGLVIGFNATSIAQIWDWIMMALGAGVVVPNVLRWYWWRLNGAGFAIGTLIGLLSGYVGGRVDEVIMRVVDAFLAIPNLLLTLLIVTVLGLLAATRIPVQMIPDLEVRTISVETRWPGATPQDIEKEILIEQEEYLRTIPNLRRLEATASSGSAEIELDFPFGVDMTETLIRVNNALTQVPSYPINVDEPRVFASSFSSNSFMFFNIAPLPGNPRELDMDMMRDFMEDNVRTRLSNVPGVSEVSVRGGAERVGARGLERATMAEFARTYMQTNPLYLNTEFARAHGFADLPASPQMVFNVTLSLGVQNDSEKAIANLGYYDVCFLRPVYPGDTLFAKSEGWTNRWMCGPVMAWRVPGVHWQRVCLPFTAALVDQPPLN